MNAPHDDYLSRLNKWVVEMLRCGILIAVPQLGSG
jgi:hypothetical protein